MNEAEFLMSCLKKLIEKQNSEAERLQDNIFSLEKENKHLVDKNVELLKETKK